MFDYLIPIVEFIHKSRNKNKLKKFINTKIGKKVKIPIYNNYNLGGGALRSTVPDLANFLITYMNQGSFNSKQILLPQTVDLMQTAYCSKSSTDLGDLIYNG
ncbi:MAG: hypothetical protein ACFFKA_10915 [Candidatus Thorarchaeota archaeon]